MNIPLLLSPTERNDHPLLEGDYYKIVPCGNVWILFFLFHCIIYNIFVMFLPGILSILPEIMI